MGRKDVLASDELRYKYRFAGDRLYVDMLY